MRVGKKGTSGGPTPKVFAVKMQWVAPKVLRFINKTGGGEVPGQRMWCWMSGKLIAALASVKAYFLLLIAIYSFRQND